MFEAAATSISSTYQLTNDDDRAVLKVQRYMVLLPIAGGCTGVVFGTLGLPDRELPPFTWLITAILLIVPYVLLFWAIYHWGSKRNMQPMPGVDTSWYRLTVGENALTTEDDTVTQVQRYNRFRFYRRTETMLILYRANRNHVLVPLDRVPEELQRALVTRLLRAGVFERPTASVFVRILLFVAPAVFLAALSALSQGARPPTL